MKKKDITHTAYFECILQLRNVTQEVVSYVDKEIERNDVHVAEVTELPNGFDYFLGDTKFLNQLGKRLRAQFPGDVKTSVRLFTQSKTTSKLVYRTTVLFRGIPFKVGDKVLIRGREFEIARLSTKVTIKDTE